MDTIQDTQILGAPNRFQDTMQKTVQQLLMDNKLSRFFHAVSQRLYLEMKLVKLYLYNMLIPYVV